MHRQHPNSQPSASQRDFVFTNWPERSIETNKLRNPMKSLRLLSAMVCLALALPAFAQDIHFSQFYLSPVNLNPALTGVMNCNIRIAANYRNQLSSILRSDSYNTYSVSYDQKIPVGRYDYFGFGAVFWGDQAGSANFSTLTGKAAFSYSKRIAGNRSSSHYLVAGVEAGVAQRSLDFLNLRWGLQHDGQGGFDPTLPSGEGQVPWNDNVLFADLGAGLLWFSVWDNGANFYAGAAFHHLNRANQALEEGAEDLVFTRFTGHAGGEVPLSDRIGLAPGIITMFQGPSFQVNGGTSLKFMLGNQRTEVFHIGLWGRLARQQESGLLADAVIISSRFDYRSFTIGFSYDINTSKLAQASNAQGAFEFALMYQICGKENRGVYCPNF